MTGIDFAKESLLYIAMVFVTTGATILAGKEYVAGALFLLLAAGLIIVRAILKKKGYEIEKEKEGNL
jgi:hypothetical protein